MKKLMVAMVAVMFLLGFNAVSFADEKAGGKMESKGEMKGDAKGGEMKGDAKAGEKKEEKKKEEKKKK